ncbi:hypothetical protein VKT23_008713 [Stygiomarasmius scandens]|uniref:Uncharacterized protein n=1 Tax=Marasmiellus scandens TaxID=2682957 RepID=A0ABR1JH74_9AGAR
MQGCAWVCGVFFGDEKSVVEQAKGAFGLSEGDLILGAHKVFLSHSESAFHILEDHTRSQGVEEQKHNCLRGAEAEADLDPRGGLSDPYAPYPIPTLNAKYEHNLGAKSIHQLSLVANASPFQRADLYNDEYKENRSIARMTLSLVSAPSRYMFQNTTDPKKALMDKEAALAGEMVQATEVLKESSARRC